MIIRFVITFQTLNSQYYHFKTSILFIKYVDIHSDLKKKFYFITFLKFGFMFSKNCHNDQILHVGKVKTDNWQIILLAGWRGVATWRWIANDDNCGICRMPFDASCPDCKMPGDDCPLGNKAHKDRLSNSLVFLPLIFSLLRMLAHSVCNVYLRVQALLFLV